MILPGGTYLSDFEDHLYQKMFFIINKHGTNMLQCVLIKPTQNFKEWHPRLVVTHMCMDYHLFPVKNHKISLTFKTKLITYPTSYQYLHHVKLRKGNAFQSTFHEVVKNIITKCQKWIWLSYCKKYNRTRWHMSGVLNYLTTNILLGSSDS